MGRIKDMVIVGGFNVYPAEVEDMIRDHPDILNVAVIGVPDDRLGDVVCAFVIMRDSGTATDSALLQEEMIAWCRKRMANFKVPRYVAPLEEFPMTGSNKVSKVDLRNLAEQMEIGRTKGAHHIA